MVEVDVEIIPPSQEEDTWYSHNFFLDHGTARDGWIYITNSKANDDKVVFVCNGEDGGTQRRQNADWSIPTSVLTAPRHIIIQVQRSHVSLFEKTGDGLRHIASRTCPRPFPSFPYFTVKTQCYGQYCADLQCTTIPPTRRPGPFPSLSYSTIQLGNNEMVEVDVEIIPPSQEEDTWYSHNFFLDHGTARDGWIYITNSKANDDKVVFVCNGEDGGTQRRQNADWSIPTSVLTAPRHIIIQVQRSHVSLFEKTGDGPYLPQALSILPILHSENAVLWPILC
ncbi:hypothetical protein Pcinc_004800 [Petrolisthes cinctipes]|uniref:Uncharacterized protein n=1 Tax=Petrolisthes cinctipes TaxID=88211 RepID=A0AAE1GEM5_PETCI|nr:hypothetical protein Pcinc_004800 [Petrolisthes cinctipes]